MGEGGDYGSGYADGFRDCLTLVKDLDAWFGERYGVPKPPAAPSKPVSSTVVSMAPNLGVNPFATTTNSSPMTVMPTGTLWMIQHATTYAILIELASATGKTEPEAARKMLAFLEGLAGPGGITGDPTNNKIGCIKCLRNATRLSLKEAKDLIDKWGTNLNLTYNQWLLVRNMQGRTP